MHTPRLVRAAVTAGTLALATLASSAAHAQFANHSLGIEGGFAYIANPSAQNVGSGGNVGIDSTLYIENGFDLYFRLLIGVHRQQEPSKNVIGILPAVGFRYLFSEDLFRPYVGLSLAYLAFFTDDYTSRIAVSPMVGFEYFVSYNMSLGLQAEYDLIISLNDSPEHAAVVAGKVAWYF